MLDQHFSCCALEQERVFGIRRKILDLVRVSVHRVERDALLEEALVAIDDLDLRTRDCVVGVEADVERYFAIGLLRASEGEDSVQVGVADGSDGADRHPELGEVDRLAGFKKGIGFLVSEQTGLYFNVGGIIIGEGFAPFEALVIDSP